MQHLMKNLNYGLNLLKKIIDFSFDVQGFPKSRNLRQLIFYLKYFILIREWLKESQNEIPEYLDEIIYYLGQSYNFTWQNTNQSLLFNGNHGADNAEFDKYLKFHGYKFNNENNLKFKIYQQCSDVDRDEIKKIYAKLNIDFKLFSFSDDLFEYYQKADLAITRSGASSIAELINLRIPFVAIPLPSSTDNHQFENAFYFKNKGYCFLLEEKFIHDKLFEILKDLNKDRKKLLLLKKITKGNKKIVIDIKLKE